MIQTPWVFYNMNQLEWSKLTWLEKKNKLAALGYCPKPVDSGAPEGFQGLFQAYCRGEAEKQTIRFNCSQLKQSA